MTLEQAIEILSNPSPRLRRCASQTFIEASRLGKEAGKEIQHLRHIGTYNVMDLLPGETKEKKNDSRKSY
ncbi:hypothetical protein ES705_30744 [subsurface metagenome]